jgi:hypothetical protein
VRLLLVVYESDGGFTEVHNGDKTLEQAARSAYEGELVGIELIFIALVAAFPVPGIGIGDRHGVFPVLDIRYLRGAGFDHGAAGSFDPDPFYAVAVDTAGGAARLVFRVAVYAEVYVLFAVEGDPHRGLAVIKAEIILSGSDRVGKEPNFVAAVVLYVFADFKFVGCEFFETQ